MSKLPSKKKMPKAKAVPKKVKTIPAKADEKMPNQLGHLNKPKGAAKKIMIDKSAGRKNSQFGKWMDGKSPGKQGEGKVRLDPTVMQGDAMPSFAPSKKPGLAGLTKMKAVAKSTKKFRKKANI